MTDDNEEDSELNDYAKKIVASKRSTPKMTNSMCILGIAENKHNTENILKTRSRKTVFDCLKKNGFVVCYDYFCELIERGELKEKIPTKAKKPKTKTDISTREKSPNQQNQPEQNKEKPKQQSFKLKDLNAESEAFMRKSQLEPSPMIKRMLARQAKLDEEELRIKNENSSN